MALPAPLHSGYSSWSTQSDYSCRKNVSDDAVVGWSSLVTPDWLSLVRLPLLGDSWEASLGRGWEGIHSSRLLDPRSWADFHFHLIPLVNDFLSVLFVSPRLKT